MYNFRGCCGWRLSAAADEAEPLLDSEAAFEAVRDAIHTVTVKRKYLHYQMVKLEAEARACPHRAEARATLLLRRKIEKQYELLLGFYSNLCDVRLQLENAATLGQVAVTMELATSMMAAAASKLGAVDRVEDIMFDLREHRVNIDNFNDALAATDDGHDDELLRELDAADDDLGLPDAPQTKLAPYIDKSPAPVLNSNNVTV